MTTCPSPTHGQAMGLASGVVLGVEPSSEGSCFQKGTIFLTFHRIRRKRCGLATEMGWPSRGIPPRFPTTVAPLCCSWHPSDCVRNWYQSCCQA